MLDVEWIFMAKRFIEHFLVLFFTLCLCSDRPGVSVDRPAGPT